MKKKIKKSIEPISSRIKKSTEMDNSHISFSFKYLDIQIGSVFYIVWFDPDHKLYP